MGTERAVRHCPPKKIDKYFVLHAPVLHPPDQHPVDIEAELHLLIQFQTKTQPTDWGIFQLLPSKFN